MDLQNQLSNRKRSEANSFGHGQPNKVRQKIIKKVKISTFI